MIFDSMFTQNTILGTALQAANVRNGVISGNIANADTPNYKKKTVDFESYLQDALDQAKVTGTIDLSKLEPTIRTIHTNYEYRLDGNNVDIESEMVDLYQNSVKYEAMVDSVTSNSRRFNLVLNGR